MISPAFLVTVATYVLLDAVSDSARGVLATTCVVCIVMVLYRSYMWDEHGRPLHIVERRVEYGPEPEPEPIRPYVHTEEPSRIRVGPWNFARSEWRSLARVLLADGCVRRESLRGIQDRRGEPLFSNLNEQYKSIVDELQRLEWVDDEKNVTPAFSAWLDAERIALPSST